MILVCDRVAENGRRPKELPSWPRAINLQNNWLSNYINNCFSECGWERPGELLGHSQVTLGSRSWNLQWDVAKTEPEFYQLAQISSVSCHCRGLRAFLLLDVQDPAETEAGLGGLIPFFSHLDTEHTHLLWFWTTASWEVQMCPCSLIQCQTKS